MQLQQSIVILSIRNQLREILLSTSMQIKTHRINKSGVINKFEHEKINVEL